jgi:misacylated tRNA(Ala) deacylase
METHLLYQTDAYASTFEGTVVGVEGPALALDVTAFYPGGGGQPCDVGRLTDGERSWPVVRVRRQGPLVWHEVEGDPLVIGTRVVGELDWERRYALMRTHTAMHILCGVVWHDFGAKATGNNMEPLRGRMDLEFESMRSELVREIEARMNAEVAAARPIRVAFLPRAEADRRPELIRTKVNLLPPELTIVRTVEIVGLDLQADGGTHVASTRQVGPIRVTDYKSKGKINKRIEFALATDKGLR